MAITNQSVLRYRKSMGRILLLGLFCLLLSLFCGQTHADGPGTTGAAFLKINAGPRATAMGGAFTALANDGYGMFWNPAGMSRLETSSFNAGHHRQVFEVNNEIVSLALPLFPNHSMGISSRFLHTTDQFRTERNRDEGREFTNFDASLGINYAYGSRNGFAYGFGVKAIRSKLADFRASSYAVDLGLHYQSPRTPLKLGMSVQNIGPDITFISEGDPLPRTFRMGWAYDFLVLNRRLVFGNDLIYFQPENISSIAVGLEFQAASFLSLRSGFNTPQDFGGESELHGGIGFSLYGLKIDYSFTQRDILADLHRVSLSIKFGGRPEPATYRERPDFQYEYYNPQTSQNRSTDNNTARTTGRELSANTKQSLRQES